MIPFTTLEAILFSVLVYFMVGLTYTAGAFFTYLLVVLLTIWAFASWIRVVASFAPSQVVSSSVRLTSFLAMKLFFFCLLLVVYTIASL